jgi:hypothetical protein
MIQIKYGEVTYDIPTNFDELTWKQFVSVLELIDKNVVRRVANVTAIPEKELSKLTVVDFSKLCEIVSFIDIPGVVQQYSLPHEHEINIGAESYGKLEDARQKITQSKNYLICGGEVWKIYFNEDISNDLIPLAITKINFLYSQINGFLERFKDLYEGEPEAEEYLAGVEVFNKFGCFPTLDRLVKEWGGALHTLPNETPHDAVLRVSAEVVMTKLLYDYQTGKYKDRLFEIRKGIPH